MKLTREDFEKIDAIQERYPEITRRVIILVYKQQFGKFENIVKILDQKNNGNINEC